VVRWVGGGWDGRMRMGDRGCGGREIEDGRMGDRGCG